MGVLTSNRKMELYYSFRRNTIMKRELNKCINEMLSFWGLEKDITNVVQNVGTVWFDYQGKTFSIQVSECTME